MLDKCIWSHSIYTTVPITQPYCRVLAISLCFHSVSLHSSHSDNTALTVEPSPFTSSLLPDCLRSTDPVTVALSSIHVLPMASMSSQMLSSLFFHVCRPGKSTSACHPLLPSSLLSWSITWLHPSLSVHTVTHPLSVLSSSTSVSLSLSELSVPTPPSLSLSPSYSLGDRMTSTELGDTVSLSQTWRERKRERERKGGRERHEDQWGFFIIAVTIVMKDADCEGQEASSEGKRKVKRRDGWSELRGGVWIRMLQLIK